MLINYLEKRIEDACKYIVGSEMEPESKIKTTEEEEDPKNSVETSPSEIELSDTLMEERK